MKKTNEEKKRMVAEEMTDNEMNDILVELRDTYFWQAIKRYNDYRKVIATSSLITLDPFKDPTIVARNQGILSGLVDLGDYIMQVKNNRAKAEEEEESKNKEKQ